MGTVRGHTARADNRSGRDRTVQLSGGLFPGTRRAARGLTPGTSRAGRLTYSLHRRGLHPPRCGGQVGEVPGQAREQAHHLDGPVRDHHEPPLSAPRAPATREGRGPRPSEREVGSVEARPGDAPDGQRAAAEGTEVDPDANPFVPCVRIVEDIIVRLDVQSPEQD